MPRYQITAPDGRVVTVEGDNPPTQEDATTIFAQLPPKEAKGRPKDMLGGKAKPAPAEVDKERGAGGMLADMALEGGGATGGQIIGAIPALSVPTGGLSIPLGGAIGGTAGNLASQKRRILAGEQQGYRPGEALASFFTGMIPGASLEASGGKAIAREALKQGAGGLAGRTIETVVDEGRLPSAAEYTVSGILPAAGGALAQRIQAANPKVASAVSEANARRATERATLAAGRDAGLVVPPSLVNPGTVNDLLESAGGKAAVKQQAAIKNQPTVNAAVKRELGIPDAQDITEDLLDDIREKASKPYQKIEAMAEKAKVEKTNVEKATEGMSSHETEALRAIPANADKLKSLAIQTGADISALRKARNTATTKFRQYARSADPDHLDEARAALENANVLEQRIEDAAVDFGAPELVKELREGRTLIAKTYDAENALNVANSNIDPQKLASALRKGKPLSGELETIGAMALAYPQVMKEASKVGAPGVSALLPIGMAAGALGGSAATKSAGGAALGLLPFLRGPARALVLSEPYQNFATRIPLSIDARPPARSVATRTLAQEAAQEISDEVEPKKKSKAKE